MTQVLGFLHRRSALYTTSRMYSLLPHPAPGARSHAGATTIYRHTGVTGFILRHGWYAASTSLRGEVVK